MSNDAITPAAPTTTATLASLLKDRKDSIAQLVPKHLEPERLMRVAVNCVGKTPGLQKCSPTSLLQSVLVAAELGLEPGGALGHLYLVPFGNVCTPIIGYRGLVELARRSGEVASVRAVVVYEKDRFRMTEGLEQTIDHEPWLDGDAGALKYAYCVVKLKEGGYIVEVMSRAQIDAVKARSRSSSNGPWVTDYNEMAKKTVARRCLKWAPLSSERFARAVEFDNVDAIDGEVVEHVLAEQPEATSIAVKERVKKRMPMTDVPAPAEIAAETDATA